MFDQETIDATRAIARARGIEPAALLAVAEVESGGTAFATIGGRREPLIRFEGHYFHRQIGTETAREKAVAAGLASPTAGAVKNPNGQLARWRMLEQAAAIDRQAAYESCSWGIGQVMGSHWKWLGFASVLDLVELARRDVAGQIELMVRYIEKASLKGALERRDWAAFARAYNGPGYKRNRYDTNMAKAYARWLKRLGSAATAAPAGDPVLQLGARGDAVREVQRLLLMNHKADIAIDGVFGAHTRDQVVLFQLREGLRGDGIVGERTWARLRQVPARPAETVAPATPEDTEDAMVDTIANGILGWLARLFGWGR